MPVPSLITDLSTTPAANISFINGASDAVATVANHIRTSYSFIRQNYDSILLKQNILTAGSIPANWLAAGAAIANIGYTPVNKAGDSGIGAMSADAFTAISYVKSPAIYTQTSAPENTQRLHYHGRDVAGNTRYLLGLDTDNEFTFWTYALGGVFASQFKFRKDSCIYLPQATVGITGLDLGGGQGTIYARQFKSGPSQDILIDAVTGKNTYINYYGGTSIIFGSGAGSSVGSLSNTGQLSLNSGVSAGLTGTAGYVGLSPSGNTNTGYLSFWSAGNVRRGYIGYNDGTDILYDSDGYGGHRFSQDLRFTSSVGLQKAGYRGTPTRSIGVSTTLLADDSGRAILISGASIAVTIPASTYIDGDCIIVDANGSAGTTIVPGSGVTLNWPNASGTATSTGTRTLAAHGEAFIRMRSTNSWVISGRGIS